MSQTSEKSSILDAEDLPRFDELLPFLSNAEVQTLYDHLDEVELVDGEELFHQGCEGEILYILKGGAIKIIIENEDNTRTQLTKLTEGHIIGEIAFLMGSPHSATAQAEGETSLFLLHKHHFEALVLEDPTLVFKIVLAINKVLCYRLARMNKQLSGMTNWYKEHHDESDDK